MTSDISIRIAKRLSESAKCNSLCADRNLSRLAGRVTILLYHRIAERHEESWLESSGVPAVSPHAFGRQLDELRRINGQFFTLDQIHGGAFPDPDRPGFVISFDDGFRDNFTVGTRILNQRNIPGVFFVTASQPERTDLLWEHRLFWLASIPEKRAQLTELVEKSLGVKLAGADPTCAIQSLIRPGDADSILSQVRGNATAGEVEAKKLYPTWTEIRLAASEGHQIASHTHDHRMRHTLSVNEFESELRESKALLETQLGCSVNGFSYPYNGYLLGDEDRCRTAGYTQIATVDPGRLNQTVSWDWLPRRSVFRIHESMIRFRGLLIQEGF